MNLEDKIRKSKEIILKTSRKWSPKEIAIAWTGREDSTVLLHLVKETFKGKIPFYVLFYDSTFESGKVYELIKKLKKEWRLNLLWIKPLPQDLKAFQQAKREKEKKETRHIAKINALNLALDRYQIKALVREIRRKEEEGWANEKYFSTGSTYTRVYPILHFTLDDIERYIQLHSVPYLSNVQKQSSRKRNKDEVKKRLRQLGYW